MADEDDEFDMGVFDRLVLQVFEEQEERAGSLTYPLSSHRQALDFIKLMNRKGFPYRQICEAIGEKPETFRSWRLGNGNTHVGVAMMKRINKTVQEATDADYDVDDFNEDDIEADGFLDDIGSDGHGDSIASLSDNDDVIKKSSSVNGDIDTSQIVNGDVIPNTQSRDDDDTTMTLSTANDDDVMKDYPDKADVIADVVDQPTINDKLVKSGVPEPEVSTIKLDHQEEDSSPCVPELVIEKEDTPKLLASLACQSDVTVDSQHQPSEIESDESNRASTTEEVQSDTTSAFTSAITEQQPTDFAVSEQTTQNEVKQSKDDVTAEQPRQEQPRDVIDDVIDGTPTVVVDETEVKVDESTDDKEFTGASQLTQIPTTPTDDVTKDDVKPEMTSSIVKNVDSPSASHTAAESAETPSVKEEKEEPVKYEASTKQVNLLDRLAMLRERAAQRKAAQESMDKSSATSSPSLSRQTSVSDCETSSKKTEQQNDELRKTIPSQVSSPTSTLSKRLDTLDIKPAEKPLGHQQESRQKSEPILQSLGKEMRQTTVTNKPEESMETKNDEELKSGDVVENEKKLDSSIMRIASSDSATKKQDEAKSKNCCEKVAADDKLNVKIFDNESSSTKKEGNNLAESHDKTDGTSVTCQLQDDSSKPVAAKTTVTPSGSDKDEHPDGTLQNKKTANQETSNSVLSQIETKASTEKEEKQQTAVMKDPKKEDIKKIIDTSSNDQIEKPATCIGMTNLPNKSQEMKQTKLDYTPNSVQKDESKPSADVSPAQVDVKNNSKIENLTDKRPKSGVFTEAVNTASNQLIEAGSQSPSAPAAGGIKQLQKASSNETVIKKDTTTTTDVSPSACNIKRVRTTGRRRVEVTLDKSYNVGITDSYDSDMDAAASNEKTYSLVDRVRKLKAAVVESPGFLYVFTDSPTEDSEGRVDIKGQGALPRFKVGVSRYPGKRLQQAQCFNLDIKPVIVVAVKRRLEALRLVREKLDQFKVNDTVDWFACDDDVMDSLVDDVVNAIK